MTNVYVLLVTFFLNSGAIENRAIVVDNPTRSVKESCEGVKPLVLRLYREGKFDDGPRPVDIKTVQGQCVEIQRQSKV